jgi:hypothetical protein
VLFIVEFAQNVVVAQVELVTDAEPLVALMARKALEVIHVVLGSHDHLKRRNDLLTGRAVTSDAEQP